MVTHWWAVFSRGSSRRVQPRLFLRHETAIHMLHSAFMASRQIIATTVFGPRAEDLGATFGSFRMVPDAELHVFVYNPQLPQNRIEGAHYHLVEPDAAFVSVRRDALFRRWTLPDRLQAEYALVVDGADAICLQALPRFEQLLRGASFAGAVEWTPPVRIMGQGSTSAYINAGVTFWHLPSSRTMREEIVARGRAHYRGPFDDQTTLNEVLHTKYFDQIVILPSQFNWRALYRKNFRSWHHNFRSWPRVDCLDGVYIYHNQHCVREVNEAIRRSAPLVRAELPGLPQDREPLSPAMLLWRRILNRLRYS